MIEPAEMPVPPAARMPCSMGCPALSNLLAPNSFFGHSSSWGITHVRLAQNADDIMAEQGTCNSPHSQVLQHIESFRSTKPSSDIAECDTCASHRK